MIDHGFAETVQKKFQSSMTEHYRSHLDGTNINKTSMLTTDYLNHFSGVLMLMEMLPSAPAEFAEDVLAWSPLSYVEHFEVTGFRDKELAVRAYEHAPYDVRVAFDKVIDDLNSTLVDVLGAIETSMQARETAGLAELCARVTPEVRALINKAADIINQGASNVVALHQDETENCAEDAQEEIDALFD